MNLRVSVLGDPGVGKSAITVRYLTKRFIGEYSSGLDISYQTSFTAGEVPVRVDILDTSSSQSSGGVSCRDVYAADAFMVVYDVTAPPSWHRARAEVRAVRAAAGAAVPVLLMANKMDLAHRRQIPCGEVAALAEAAGCQLAEVSALAGTGGLAAAVRGLLHDAAASLSHRGRPCKRRRSLLENVSRKLGSVFRRKSFDEGSSPSNKRNVLRFAHNNRHSV